MIGRLIAWFAELLRPAPGAAPPLPTATPSAPAKSAPRTVNHEQAVQLVGQVTELAAVMAEHVGQHTGSIGTLNAELRDVQQGDAVAVADVIRKLLAANDQLNRRLEQAEYTLQAQHRQLQNVVSASRTDSLTGLMNRRCLDEELSRCLTNLARKKRPSVLVMVDVDHFKQFNDQYGHPVGDIVLKHVADTLAARYRETDVVARFGGEEFAIIMHGATCQQALERADQARAAIGAAEIEVDGRLLRVTASAGVAETAENDSAVSLLARSDAALYAAKRHGRNCSFWFNGQENVLVQPQASEPAGPAVEAAPELSEDQQIELELAQEQFADTTFVANIARRIAEWRRGGATFSVILARLDNTKALLAAGDHIRSEAVRLVGKQAPRSLRDMDLSTRWMSDGVAVLLPGATANDSLRVARRFLTGVQGLRVNTGEAEVSLSLSLGVAEGIEGNDAQRVLRRAWQALNAANGAGPGGIFLHDGVKTRECGTATVSR